MEVIQIFRKFLKWFGILEKGQKQNTHPSSLVVTFFPINITAEMHYWHPWIVFLWILFLKFASKSENLWLKKWHNLYPEFNKNNYLLFTPNENLGQNNLRLQ